MRKSLVIRFSYDIEMRKLANRNIAIICVLYMAYNSRQPDIFGLSVIGLRKDMRQEIQSFFAAYLFFVSFCLYFKESCSCTGVHQLVILIKSGCDSLCRRKSGRIPEFSSGISGKLYNSLRRNSSHIRYKLLNFSFRSPLFLTYKCIIDHLKEDYVPNEKKKQTKFAEERNYVPGL